MHHNFMQAEGVANPTSCRPRAACSAPASPSCRAAPVATRYRPSAPATGHTVSRSPRRLGRRSRSRRLSPRGGRGATTDRRRGAHAVLRGRASSAARRCRERWRPEDAIIINALLTMSITNTKVYTSSPCEPIAIREAPRATPKARPASTYVRLSRIAVWVERKPYRVPHKRAIDAAVAWSMVQDQYVTNE